MSTTARSVSLLAVAALLISCASPSQSPPGGATVSAREPGAGPARPPARVPSEAGWLRADVAWSDRVDHQPWAGPLPPGRDGWPTEPPSRWPDLRARLVLPASVRAGETVDYVVVLRNASARPVDLRPCGGYEQEVMVVGPGLGAVSVDGGTSTFRLSCDTDPVLLPQETRRYAMRLAVPVDLTGDEVLFRWGFVDNMPDHDAQAWVRLTTVG